MSPGIRTEADSSPQKTHRCYATARVRLTPASTRGAVFAGREGLTLGIGTVGCAAAAGAVDDLVSYGMSCGSSAGGCSVQGALVSTGVGALGGALGGALAGPLGGKLASSVLGDVLPELAVRAWPVPPWGRPPAVWPAPLPPA
jgi:hypothetical protein